MFSPTSHQRTGHTLLPIRDAHQDKYTMARRTISAEQHDRYNSAEFPSTRKSHHVPGIIPPSDRTKPLQVVTVHALHWRP